MSKTTEWGSLVRKAQAGDEKAFQTLFQNSYQKLEKACYSVLKHPEDVEDALQETYLKIYRNFSGEKGAPLKDPDKFLPWAERIAKNTSITYLDHKMRKSGKDEFRPTNSEEDTAGMDVFENGDANISSSPDKSLEEQAIHELINTAMDTIATDRRMCLALYQEGYKQQEISEKLNIPLGTVKSNIHYGKKQLQQAIQEVEEKYDLKIHGFSWIPLLAAEKVREKDGGWISASSAEEFGKPQNAAEENLLRKLGIQDKVRRPRTGARVGLAKKIIAVVASVLIIAGGIAMALHFARQSVSPNSTGTTTAAISQSANAARESQRNPGAGQPANRQNAVNPGAQQAARPQQAAQPVEQAAPTTQAPSTTVTTSREWQENTF